MSDSDWQTFVRRMDLDYLAGTRFIHANGHTWIILASAVHLPVLNEGLRPMLQREARALFGRSLSLRFVDMATVERDPRLRAILLRDLPAVRAGFLAWFTGCATSPKTLQNRCMEIQRRRPDLDADKDTRQQREHQSRAGPVR